jgi:radical SAM-linked protein
LNDVQNFTEIRLFYTKTGSAKYISHLDVMRAFQRALKRTKIKFWYTEGFHPHLYLNFALPLSLGYESLCESVDFRLLEEIPPEELAKRIGAMLTVGFQVLSAGLPVMNASRSLRRTMNHVFPSGRGERTCSRPGRNVSAGRKFGLKKTKRGSRSLTKRRR